MTRETRTISIQPGLSARLAEFPDENWSAIACRAFEVRLAELDGMKATTDQEGKAIARIKASKMRATDELFRDGEAAGAWYFLHHADFRELERLSRNYERYLLDFDSDNSSFRSLATIMCDDGGLGSDTEELVRRTYGDDIDQARWMEGFVQGAVAKFNEIQSKLD